MPRAKFHLGRLPGPPQKGKKPREAATYPQLLEAIESSFITDQEARSLALHVLVRARTCKEPADPTDPRLRRDGPEIELEGAC